MDTKPTSNFDRSEIFQRLIDPTWPFRSGTVCFD